MFPPIPRSFLAALIVAIALIPSLPSSIAVPANRPAAGVARAADAPPDRGIAAAASRVAVPDAPADSCQVGVGKTASPSNVEVGQAVRVTLSLRADCPDRPGGARPADIVLALDRSNSQYDNGTWPATLAAAATFLSLVDFSRSQVGLVAFGTDARLGALDAELVQPLTADAALALDALDRIPEPPDLGLWTNITAAVETAQAELASARHRPEAQPVLILLSDGGHNALLAGSPQGAANAAKQAGTLIITVGLGVDASASATLTALASRPELYYPAPSVAELEGVMREVAGAVSVPGVLSELVVTDILSSEVELVAGSVEPAPTRIDGDSLIWEIPSLAAAGWSASYLVRPRVPGRYSPNKLAYVDFLDADGEPAGRVFPDPMITVRAPGEAIKVFAPVVYRGYCKPGRPFDVVLLLDTSSSMDGEKLDATRAAARAFLGYLDLPPSRAAVLAFNAFASVVQDLSDDRPALLAALDRLPRGAGTRIDFALQEAVAVLSGTGRDPESAAAIVLITDGRHQGDGDGSTVQDVINAAAGARRVATVYTVGIGADVDPQLLTRVAGDPDRYYAAPSPADLVRIYVDIAGALPCGGR